MSTMTPERARQIARQPNTPEEVRELAELYLASPLGRCQECNGTGWKVIASSAAPNVGIFGSSRPCKHEGVK